MGYELHERKRVQNRERKVGRYDEEKEEENKEVKKKEREEGWYLKEPKTIQDQGQS